MKRFDTVIYDLDGTLLNTLEDLAVSINYALAQMGYPTRTLDEVRRFLGSGARELTRMAMPESADEEAVDKTLRLFQEYYGAHTMVYTTAYPGIMEMLTALRDAGVQQAVVSNKPDAQVKSLCRELFGDYVQLAMGDREGARRKPAPDGVLNTMAELNARPESTLYVGDSDVDVHTAHNAGLPCAAVTWGFRTEAQLREAGATMFFHTARELENWILNA